MIKFVIDTLKWLIIVLSRQLSVQIQKDKHNNSIRKGVNAH